MADIHKFKKFFDSMGVVYEEDASAPPQQIKHEGRTRVLYVAQAIFHFKRSGGYLGVQCDEMTSHFDPRKTQ